MRRLALSTLMGGLLAGCLAAQPAITLPSGQAVTFLEQREEADAGILRLRFIAPDLASPLRRPSFEDLTLDLEVLCVDFGLKKAANVDDLPKQIVVSLSAEPVEFGVANTEVEQVFEAFTAQNETCMLEMF